MSYILTLALAITPVIIGLGMVVLVVVCLLASRMKG